MDELYEAADDESTKDDRRAASQEAIPTPNKPGLPKPVCPSAGVRVTRGFVNRLAAVDLQGDRLDAAAHYAGSALYWRAHSDPALLKDLVQVAGHVTEDLARH